MVAWTGAAGGTDWTYIRHTDYGQPDDQVFSNWSTSPNLPADGDSVTIGAGITVTGGGGTFSSLSIGAGSAVTPGDIAVTAGMTNAGTLTMLGRYRQSFLSVAGALSNSGLIVLDGRTDITFPDATLALSGTVVLSGGGTVRLVASSLSAGGITAQSDVDATLSNADNAIEGTGAIYGSRLTFKNYGVVNANVATSGLAIRAAGVVNNGTIEATGGAALTIDAETVDGSGGGTLQALDGSHLELYGTQLKGSLSTTGTGYVRILNDGNGGSVTFDGSASLFTTSATIIDTDINANARGGSLRLKGQVKNTGLITETNTIFADQAGATLSGGGTIKLAGGAIRPADQGDSQLTNVDNTISGYGTIRGGQSKLTFVNQGTITADDANNSLTLGGGNFSLRNAGVIQATGAGGLVVSATVNNQGHAITVGNGSFAQLTDSTIQGGTLTSTGSGYFSVLGYPGALTLDGATYGAITSNATLKLGGAVVNGNTFSGTLTTTGSFINNGTILDTGTGNVKIGGTLSGTGQIVLDNGSIEGTLANNGNTISGQGTIRATATFAAGSVLNANVSGAALGIGDFTNAGLMEATGGGRLNVGGTDNNQGGTIAAGDGSVVDVSHAAIQGGTLTSTGSGYLTTVGYTAYTTLDGTTHGAITSTATIQVNNAQEAYVAQLATTGSFINNGTVIVSSAGLMIAGGTLSGTGAVVLQGGYNGEAMRGSLVAYGNTISGQGGINATVDLEAGATLNANVSGTALSVSDSGMAVTNNGLLQASNGGTLSISAAVTGSGSALITGGGTLAFGNAFNESVAFQGRNAGTLKLAASYGGTISGFVAGNTIDLTGVSYKASDTLGWTVNATNSGGTLTIRDGSTAIASLTFAGRYAASAFAITNDSAGKTLLTSTGPVARPATKDFNGDGRSDILVQGDDGSVAVGFVGAGLAVTGIASVASPGAAWHLVGSADLDGDGAPDLVFQNTDGRVEAETLNGTAVRGTGLLASPGAGWHVRGLGDFTGDGRADVLLQNTDGSLQLVATGTDGVSSTGTSSLGNFGATWHLEGIGDFDGDGLRDGLFQNDDGRVGVVLQASAGLGVQVLGNPGPGATIAGTGDYNGDGKADALVHLADGSVLLGTLSGATVTGLATIGNPGAAFTSVVAGGDYNGDGKLDVAVQATDSTVAAATLDGTGTARITASAVLGQAGPGVRVVGNVPTQFIDGTAAGTLAGTPGADAFVLTAPAAGVHAITGFDAVLDRVVLSKAVFGSYAAVQAAETSSSSGTTIALGSGTSLLFQGIAPSQLGAANFAFT